MHFPAFSFQKFSGGPGPRAPLEMMGFSPSYGSSGPTTVYFSRNYSYLKPSRKACKWAKNKLLEKGMKTPSSLVTDLLTSISNCFYCMKIHKEGCQSSPWQQKLLVLSHVPPNVNLSIWSISRNLSYSFSLLWATGLVGFNWHLLHNLFHFDNGMQYIHVHFVLFAVCWNWFLVSK